MHTSTIGSFLRFLSFRNRPTVFNLCAVLFGNKPHPRLQRCATQCTHGNENGWCRHPHIHASLEPRIFVLQQPSGLTLEWVMYINHYNTLSLLNQSREVRGGSSYEWSWWPCWRVHWNSTYWWRLTGRKILVNESLVLCSYLHCSPTAFNTLDLTHLAAKWPTNRATYFRDTRLATAPLLYGLCRDSIKKYKV